MTREVLAEEALKLFEKYTSVALLWATGVGKSAAAIQMANKYLEKRPYGKVLLVVAEIAHKENWQTEFNKWGVINADLTVECYASMHKYRNTEWDLIIFDEAHHLSSDLKLEILTTIKSTKNILLSATLDRGLLLALESILGYIAPHKISLQDAIDFNILPGPRIHLIPLQLDNVKTDQWIIEEWGEQSKRIPIYTDLRDKWKYLRSKKQYPNVKLYMRCTALQKYNYLTEQSEYWKKKYMSCRQEYMKNKWMQIGIQRKRFLGEIKTNTVKKLIEKLGNKRYICFCASIAQAENLGKENTIHSKVKETQSIIDAFNAKKINNLYAVGMLQEGQNLVDIEAGIIVQLDGTERPFIQKFGRTLRASDPHQYIFYYKNTRDEEYLNNILADFNSNYINVLNVATL